VNFSWHEAIRSVEPAPALEPGHARAWVVPIGHGEEPVIADDRLHPEDLARAGTIRHLRARRHFLDCRLLLRTLLYMHTRIPPADQHLLFGPHGKPALAGSRDGVHFNVSHCDGWAMVAISTTEIGVDVEVLRPRASLPALAARYFSDAEQAYVNEASDGISAFFRVWTCKEGLLKARGVGITVPLAECDVARAVRAGGGVMDGWRFFLPALPNGILGSVVSHDETCSVECLA